LKIISTNGLIILFFGVMAFFVIFVVVVGVLLFTLAVAARFSLQILKVFRIGEG
jgi:hypothetical protein